MRWSSFAPSAFSVTITHVVQLASEEEMVWPHTQSHVAAMEHEHAFRNWPVGKFPGHAVCCLAAPVSSSKPTVSSSITQLRRGPEPATGLQIADDVGQEPLLFSEWPTAGRPAIARTAHATGCHPAFGATCGAHLQNARMRFPGAFGRLIGHRRSPPGVSRSRPFERRGSFPCVPRYVTRVVNEVENHGTQWQSRPHADDRQSW